MDKKNEVRSSETRWNDQKARLKKKYPNLNDQDLQGDGSNQDELVRNISKRTGKSEQEIRQYLQEDSQSGQEGRGMGGQQKNRSGQSGGQRTWDEHSSRLKEKYPSLSDNDLQEYGKQYGQGEKEDYGEMYRNISKKVGRPENEVR